MIEPKVGELWTHKQTGDVFLIKSCYTIMKTLRDSKSVDMLVVKALRLRDQYEIDEPFGMFSWYCERLN